MIPEQFEHLLCCTGYLPPRNEKEQTAFEEIYKNEKLSDKMKNFHVDIDAIVNKK